MTPFLNKKFQIPILYRKVNTNSPIEINFSLECYGQTDKVVDRICVIV